MRYSILLAVTLTCFAAHPASAQYTSSRGAEINPYIWGVPKGWTTGGNAELRYGTVIGGIPGGKRAALLLQARGMAENDFGTLMQSISADAYLGRRVRLSAMVSADSNLAANRIALWMRVNDASGRVAAIDDMETRSIPAGQGWQRQEVVLDVPNGAASITFGILLTGSPKCHCCGIVKVSDFKLDIVGNDVPTTAPPLESLPRSPVNLDFSQL